MDGKGPSNIFDILQERGFLNPSQIETISENAKRTGRTREEVLEESGLIPEEEIALAYSILYDLPIVHLKEEIEKDVLAKIPKEIARDFQIIPFEISTGFLKIGTPNPQKIRENPQILREISEKEKLGLELSVITRSDFQKALGFYEGKEPAKKEPVPFLDLTGIEIPYEVISKLPEVVAKKYRLAIFGFLPDKLLKIAAFDPEDPKVREILEFLKKRTNLKLEVYKTSEEGLEEAFKNYQKKEAPAIKEPVIKVEKITEEEVSPVEEDIATLLEKDIQDEKEIQEIISSNHVPRIVAALINFASQKKATDIHIQPLEKILLIRYRIDGLLRDMFEIKKELHPAIISRIKILAKLKIDEQRIPQDGRFVLNFHGKEVDIRVSTLPSSKGEKAVLRLLEKSLGILTLEQLGLQGKGFDTLVSEIQKPYGVILITGPTGSGKTTTLYAIIQRIKNPTINIITLEDPIEYEIEGVAQSQVKPEIGYDFGSGLRSILRQDPNVIMVGEIRDLETASMVTQAALTGHLVLTTLHTNDASSALPRLTNMGVEPFLITTSLNAIVAQRLVRRICQKCKEEVKMPEGALMKIEEEVRRMPEGTLESLRIKRPFQFFRGKGCDVCDKGYLGRIGIFEVLEMTPNIEEATILRKPASELEKIAEEEGMVNMKQDGILKVLQGITTYDEILRVTALE